MNNIPEFLRKLFEREGQALGWVWVLDNHVLDATLKPLAPDPPFASGQDYVVLRLAEMYLRRTRVLWREFYPLVHAFVAYGDPVAQRSIATIAGPGQLKDLGTENLDRLIGLAYRLAGPLVYDGQDIELQAGLYAVPAKDGAKLLIDTLGQLSGLVSGLVPTLKQATEVAGIMKGGVEGLLGMSGTELTLGVRDALRAPGAGVGRPARPGFLVAVNAAAASIDPAQLWIKDGRLVEGPNPPVAQPFASHDMMLFELHRGPSRATTWATLPTLAPHAQAFHMALRDTPKPNLKAKVDDLYQRFEADLHVVNDLTEPDKAAIRALIAVDLNKRVASICGGGVIEIGSVGGTPTRVEMRGFSARAIPELPPGAPLPARAEGEALFT
jgi:hypothetical protein